MGQFGGWGKFGGSFQFGGSKPHAQIYYDVLKSLGPPGLRPTDDDVLTNYLLRADCTGLQHGHILADRLFAEMFPHTTSENIAEWESLLDVVPKGGATLPERRDAVVARWRGAAGSSLTELRQMLYPLLNPSTAWVDLFEDAYFNPRWRVRGNGTQVEASGVVTIAATAAVDCELDGTTDNGNLCTQRLNDITDDYYMTALVTAYTAGLNTKAGIIAFRDYDNFVTFGIAESGAGARLQVDKVVEGVQTENVDTGSIAAPAFVTFLALQIKREAGEWIFSYSIDGATAIELQRFDAEFAARDVGMFARNVNPSFNLGSVDIDAINLVHATGYNNVTIIETDSAITALSGDEADIFFAFVHRNPGDAGTYDIANAQRQMDKAKQGHTLIGVGEADIAKWDDPYTLYDRDIFGS